MSCPLYMASVSPGPCFRCVRTSPQPLSIKPLMSPLLTSGSSTLKLSNSQNMEATYMSVNRGVDKEDVVHLHSGPLLSHKKEWNNGICSNMDRPRNYQAKFNEERQTSYTVIYKWTLKKGYKWIYLQNSDRLRDFEKLMVTKGGRDRLEIWDGNVLKLGCDDGCITINIIKFIELKNRIFCVCKGQLFFIT